MVDGATGDHQSRIKGATSDTSKRMPCSYWSMSVSPSLYLLQAFPSFSLNSSSPPKADKKGKSYDHRTNPRSYKTHVAPSTLWLGN